MPFGLFCHTYVYGAVPPEVVSKIVIALEEHIVIGVIGVRVGLGLTVIVPAVVGPYTGCNPFANEET